MNLVAGAVRRNWCSLAMKNSAELQRRPAITQLAWPSPQSIFLFQVCLCSVWIYTFYRFFLPKICQQQVHLPSHTTQVVSVILSWLVTSLSVFSYEVWFWPGFLDFEAIYCCSHHFLTAEISIFVTDAQDYCLRLSHENYPSSLRCYHLDC